MSMPSSSSGGLPTVGTPVMTADGQELGTVKEASGSCFKVDVPMRPDYWLATDCIASSSGGQVRLSVTKDHLDTAKVEGPEHTGFHPHLM